MVAAPLLLPAPDLVPRAETPESTAPCACESPRSLGDDHSARFFRCDGCGVVLVAQRNQLWVLRSTNGL